MRQLIIEVLNVWHTYPSGVTALRNVTMSVREGEFVALIGHNGCGKTTLAKHLNGLLKPTRGRVAVCGLDTRSVTTAALSSFVGYVFQNPDHQIFCNSVEEEVAFGLKLRKLPEQEIRERVARALRFFEIERYRNQHPYALTLGLRQRVALASVLALDPQIIIVDEPTTGQDHITSRVIMDFLRELNREGRTIIAITHSLRLVADYASRVVVMRKGGVIADGKPREILSRPDILERAFLSPLQIVRLATMLSRLGVEVNALTAEELAEAVVRKLGLVDNAQVHGG